MDKITGNYLTQGNKDFPLDCETLDALQTNISLVSIIGNIAGDKVILFGCVPTQDGTKRSEGYVFVRTKDFPTGEILHFEGGAVGSGMYLKQENVSVTADGYEYPKAYTKRSLAAGVGSENFNWEDFGEVQSSDQLNQAIIDLRKDLETEAAKFAPAPLGIVQLWAGADVPVGYALCNGEQLRKSDYPELFAVLGTTYNNVPDSSGKIPLTTDGFFRLPDLRGRFVVGYHDKDNDYKPIGTTGGEKKHTLAVDEMPEHTHEFKDYYYAESYAGSDCDIINIKENIGSKGTDNGNTHKFYYRHDSESAGMSAPHENRPPYYVLAYIMRIK
ncbi:MAG: tail fiber protein [Duncaniella sp.]|nr:tail fiber protein [Duncaniella sp.]